MKYIRTKDGRILRAPFTKQEYEKSFPKTAISYEKWFDLWAKDIENQAIKQANTIEELCDEIVAVPHNLEKPMLGKIEVPTFDGIDYPMFLNQKSGWYQDLYSFVGVYGAIWVINENGIPTLKPVAKLNKNGRFELL